MEYVKYPQPVKAKRIIPNSASNDFNDEPEYKMIKVLVLGETRNCVEYIVMNKGTKEYRAPKDKIIFDKEDFEKKEVRKKYSIENF